MITPTSARALSLAACWLGACAGTQTPREQRLDQAFAQIQVHEAEIERARAALEPRAASPANCEARRRAASTICRHAAELCELARDVADADALARCDQAEDTCYAARAVASGCAPAATDAR